MSGKRRRSWEKMAPHSKSNDGGWEGNLKNDDISRGRDRNIRSFHNDWETHYTTTTRKPYRSRSRSRGREWETFSGDRNKSCTNEYSRRRDDVRKEFGGARSQRGGREDQSNSKSRQISNIQCKFFAAGRCYRDDCRFSHDNPRSHDTWQPHADVNASWDDDEEIQRSHNKPSWDWDDLDNRKRSWNGRPWDDDHDHDDNKTKSRNGNGTYSMDDKHRNDNNNTHLNENANVLDTSGKGQVEIEKSPKKKQEEEEVVGNLQYEKSRSRRDKFTANNEYGRDDDDDDDVRNNSRNLKERPRYTHDRNSRNHYDDHDGDDGRRCHPSKIPCKFFSEGKCYRDDCKFSHDNITCHDSENKSWNGPSWDDVASGRNRNSHDKKKSWDDDTKKPSAIHDLNSLPSNQDTKQEGKFGNDENPEKKHRGAENGKKQEEEKVKEGGNSGSDEDKCMRHFRAALVECVKEILKPIWKEGKMTREVYKTVVKKVVDKITTTIQQNQIPPTQPKIQIYLTHSQPKIMKLVEAYVEKLVKA